MSAEGGPGRPQVAAARLAARSRRSSNRDRFAPIRTWRTRFGRCAAPRRLRPSSGNAPPARSNGAAGERQTRSASDSFLPASHQGQSPEAAPGSRRRRWAQPDQPRIAFFARLFAKAGQNAPRRWQRGGLLRCRNGNAESSKGLADVIFCRLRKSRVAAKNLGNY